MRVIKLSAKKLSVVSFLLLSLLFTVSNAQIYTDWIYQEDIKLNTSPSGANVTGSVDNFPVLIRLDESKFPFDDAQPNGEDIRFSKSDETTPLPYEIERWDSNGKEAEIWVLVDHIAGGDNTQYIIMYWGNGTAVDESDPEAIFETSNDFSGVWHLNEDPTGGSGCIKDRTSNANDATPGGSMTASDLVDGRIGKAIDFDGSNDNLNAGSGSSLDNLELFTIAAWINPKGWGENGFGRIVDKWDDYNYYGALKFFLNNNTSSGYNKTITLNREFNYNENYFTASNYSLGLNEWAYVVAVMNGNSECRLYINGTEASYYTQWFGSGSLWSDAARDLIIGNRQYGDRTYYGVIDELRISNSIRSVDWIKLSHENQKEGQTLVVIDRECREYPTCYRGDYWIWDGNDMYNQNWRTSKVCIGVKPTSGITVGLEVGKTSFFSEPIGIVIPPEAGKSLVVGGITRFNDKVGIGASPNPADLENLQVNGEIKVYDPGLPYSNQLWPGMIKIGDGTNSVMINHEQIEITQGANAFYINPDAIGAKAVICEEVTTDLVKTDQISAKTSNQIIVNDKMEIQGSGDDILRLWDNANGNGLRIGTDTQLSGFIRIRPTGGEGIAITNMDDYVGIFVTGSNAHEPRVGIGTTDPGDYRLAVEGIIGARELVVTNQEWSDYVFKDDYDLKSLAELEKFIKKNKHLPNIPTENEVKEKGLSIGDMQAKFLEKIEEMTLYIIQLQKRINELEAQK